MKNEENLNTESNSIAGNPTNGPAGNTAARPLPVSTSATPEGGSPTQLPTAASMGAAGAVGRQNATSSEELAASATSAGMGGVGRPGSLQENKAADPSALKQPARRGRKPGSTNKAKETPTAAARPQGRAKKEEQDSTSRQPENYGGNFGNDMHGSYQDEARYDNQASDASRGEFGAFGRHATHGGYGNQNREFDYNRQGSAEDGYYGGPGRYGHQHNAYRDYDGRNERWDERRDYGYDRGFHPSEEYYDRRGSYDRPRGNFSNGYHDYPDREQHSGNYNDGRGNRFDNRNQPDRGDYYSGRQNDNGSRQGRGGGYADDYGRSSLGGRDPYGHSRYDERRDERGGYSQGGYSRRNQDEDYRSSRGGYDNQGSSGGRGGHREDDYSAGNRQGGVGSTGQRNRYGEGYGYGHSRSEQPRRPSYDTGDDRNGYGRSYQGNSSQGYGSQGGSYNDAYDDSRRDSRQGSPSRGDYRREDADRNYGQDQRPQYRSDDDHDYGTAPRRNRGRDGEGDE
ncbi:hypothetical protein GCM10023185_38650 [Hymenobacter saemangeumensis]|uniref:Uncharacterized protein n=1 Tax=Hymenobacter saemangeumensis TaxID=1084522 RepID=A0ABP8IS22_9BACT